MESVPTNARKMLPLPRRIKDKSAGTSDEVKPGQQIGGEEDKAESEESEEGEDDEGEDGHGEGEESEDEEHEEDEGNQEDEEDEGSEDEDDKEERRKLDRPLNEVKRKHKATTESQDDVPKFDDIPRDIEMAAASAILKAKTETEQKTSAPNAVPPADTSSSLVHAASSSSFDPVDTQPNVASAPVLFPLGLIARTPALDMSTQPQQPITCSFGSLATSRFASTPEQPASSTSSTFSLSAECTPIAMNRAARRALKFKTTAASSNPASDTSTMKAVASVTAEQPVSQTNTTLAFPKAKLKTEPNTVAPNIISENNTTFPVSEPGASSSLGPNITEKSVVSSVVSVTSIQTAAMPTVGAVMIQSEHTITSFFAGLAPYSSADTHQQPESSSAPVLSLRHKKSAAERNRVARRQMERETANAAKKSSNLALTTVSQDIVETAGVNALRYGRGTSEERLDHENHSDDYTSHLLKKLKEKDDELTEVKERLQYELSKEPEIKIKYVEKPIEVLKFIEVKRKVLCIRYVLKNIMAPQLVPFKVKVVEKEVLVEKPVIVYKLFDRIEQHTICNSLDLRWYLTFFFADLWMCLMAFCFKYFPRQTHTFVCALAGRVPTSFFNTSGDHIYEVLEYYENVDSVDASGLKRLFVAKETIDPSQLFAAQSDQEVKPIVIATRQIAIRRPSKAANLISSILLGLLLCAMVSALVYATYISASKLPWDKLVDLACAFTSAVSGFLSYIIQQVHNFIAAAGDYGWKTCLFGRYLVSTIDELFRTSYSNACITGWEAFLFGRSMISSYINMAGEYYPYALEEISSARDWVIGALINYRNEWHNFVATYHFPEVKIEDIVEILTPTPTIPLSHANSMYDFVFEGDYTESAHGFCFANKSFVCEGLGNTALVKWVKLRMGLW